MILHHCVSCSGCQYHYNVLNGLMRGVFHAVMSLGWSRRRCQVTWPGRWSPASWSDSRPRASLVWARSLQKPPCQVPHPQWGRNTQRYPSRSEPASSSTLLPTFVQAVYLCKTLLSKIKENVFLYHLFKIFACIIDNTQFAIRLNTTSMTPSLTSFQAVCSFMGSRRSCIFAECSCGVAVWAVCRTSVDNEALCVSRKCTACRHIGRCEGRKAEI